jgi:hypothetical protein
MREHLCMPESERPDEQAVREARAIAALHEANRQLKAGDPTAELTEAAFERLRLEQPERNWPSETSVRRWLGAGTGNLSWTVSVERAGLQPPTIPMTPRPHLGPRLTRGELEQAIRLYVDEHGEPPASFSAYSAWARRMEVRVLPGRRPLSEGPFTRAFGGFRAALRTLGFADPADDAPLPPRRPGNLPHGFRYTRQQYLEALREVAAVLGRSPRSSEYVAVLRRPLQKAVEAGRPRAMPSLPMFHRPSVAGTTRWWRRALSRWAARPPL